MSFAKCTEVPVSSIRWIFWRSWESEDGRHRVSIARRWALLWLADLVSVLTARTRDDLHHAEMTCERRGWETLRRRAADRLRRRDHD